MKTNKIIILIIISIAFTSCFSENYMIITKVERDGSFRREIKTVADSLSISLFPYNLTDGWEISQTDTILKEWSDKDKYKKNIKISKKFKSIEELSADFRHDLIFPSPNESLKKRFRWFYTYYAFTAIYPEITDKGRVPMDNYLNREEQKFYLQGDISTYRGMTGFELKTNILDGLETSFMKWYSRSMYEESFEIILQYVNADLRSQLFAIKDSLYSINIKQVDYFKDPSISDICIILDKFFVTDHYSRLYYENGQEMNNILEGRTKVVDELQKFSIQYELALPGKLIATNADLQNDGSLVWKINMFKFLADDYMLTAESRVVNIWAFALTILLIAFSVACFKKLI